MRITEHTLIITEQILFIAEHHIFNHLIITGPKTCLSMGPKHHYQGTKPDYQGTKPDYHGTKPDYQGIKQLQLPDYQGIKHLQLPDYHGINCDYHWAQNMIITE